MQICELKTLKNGKNDLIVDFSIQWAKLLEDKIIERGGVVRNRLLKERSLVMYRKGEIISGVDIRGSRGCKLSMKLQCNMELIE